MVINLVLLGIAFVIIVFLGFYIDHVAKKDRPPTLTERFIIFGIIGTAASLVIANLFIYIF